MITVGLTILTMVVCADAFFFANVCFVTGTVQFYGRPAESGLPIAAYIASDKVAESFTGDNGSYELKIPEYDPSKPQIKGFRSSSDIVQVKLDGKLAKPTFSLASENLKIDLRVDQQSLDVKLSTWGKIKALFK
jgi:hypothetical protein